MNKQTAIDRHEFSKLRKQLADLTVEAVKLTQIFMPIDKSSKGNSTGCGQIGSFAYGGNRMGLK